MRLHVRVVPGSTSDCICGWLDGVLKIRVRARPENGKANRAVGRLLAKTLKLHHDNIKIVSGYTSNRKLIRIEGLTSIEIREIIDNKAMKGDTK